VGDGKDKLEFCENGEMIITILKEIKTNKRRLDSYKH